MSIFHLACSDKIPNVVIALCHITVSFLHVTAIIKCENLNNRVLRYLIKIDQ